MTDQTNRPTENDGAVRLARKVLNDASTALASVDQMSRVDLCALIGRLTGSLMGVLEYVDLTASIARHEQATREAQARIDARKDTGLPPADVAPDAESGRILSTVVSDDEHEIITALAELTDLSVADFLRQAALAAHGGHLARIADLEQRADRAERAFMEIVHTVKRLADGA